MIKLKSQQALLAFVVVVVLSATYALAAYALLQPLKATIVFTSKEIQGLSDYERAAALYFKLNTGAQPQKGEIKEARALRQRIRDIGDESNLILDPELSSYYAADLLLNDVPSFVEHVLARRNGGADSSQDWQYRFEILDHSVESVCRENSRGCVALETVVGDFRKSLLAPISSRSSAEETAALIGTVEAIARATTCILKDFLEERLRQQKIQQYSMVAGLGCLYVFLVFLIGLSSLNFVRRREIKLARETQKLAVQLAHKNDELEKFAYAAAHDLKEPVRTMRCYATLLRSESLDELPQPSLEYLDIIEGAAKRAEQMISDLLGYTQVTEKTLVLEACDSAKELKTVLEDLKPLIEAAQPEIILSALPVIFVVPSMFRRLISNLIDNAIKYRRPHTPLVIHIQAERQGAFWLFSVRDNGIGMDQKYAESVFEPFRRLEPTLYTEGQGIGLTSCRKIVERLGGQIWLASEPGVGTTIHFSLPVRSEKS